MKTFCSLFLLMGLVQIVHARTYYFSASGDDSRSATQAQSQSTPWKSINKLNSVFSIMQPGDFILFKRGDTFYGTIKITKSGTSGSPITIGAYGSGAKPLITGFLTLSNWSSVGSGKYESYNSALGTAVNMVSVNGTPREMGRYPNSNATLKGYLYRESHGTNSITDKELSSSPDWTGAEVVIRTTHWILDRVKVTDQIGGTIKYSPATSMTPLDNYGYFFQNDIRTLDQTGEWFYKPSTKKMYMYFGSNAPSNYKVQVSALKDLVYLYNQDNIVFDGLSFKGANENAIDIYSSNNTRVKNCDISESGIYGVWAQNTVALVVEGCTVVKSNNIGIYLYSNTNSSIVRNNKVKKTGTFAGMGAGGANQYIGIRANGDKNLVEYNEIDSSGYCGIRFTGNNTIIKNNFIKNFNFVTDDGGGIYTGNVGGTENYGRKIIGNIITNGIGAREGTPAKVFQTASGIYIDNNAAGISITGNTITKCGKVGIYIHNCFKIYIANNTSYDNTSQSLLNHDSQYRPTLTNVTFKHNILVSKTTAQKVSMFYTRDNDIATFGKIDSNYYARPIDDHVTIEEITGLYISDKQKRTLHTLSTWKSTYTMHDKTSKKSPKTLSSTVNPEDYIRFEYNASKLSKTISLNATYVDVKNKTYSGSITLAPYASVVLIKSSGTVTTTTSAPVVSITSPLINATYAAPASVQLTATAKDADGSISKVQFYNGTTLLRTELSAPYSWTWTGVAAGTYKIIAKATDNSGNVTTSSSVSFTVGSTNPVVKVTSPLVNAVYTASATVQLTATATDGDGISKVQFYNGTTLLKTEYTAPYSWAWTGVKAGTYKITAKATDNKGNTTTSTGVSFTVKSATLTAITGSGASSATEEPANAELVQPTLEFQLYPNPAISKLFVAFNSSMQGNERATLTIQNLLGSRLRSIPVTLSGNGIEVDVSSLRTGTYILSLASGKTVLSKKFIKGN